MIEARPVGVSRPEVQLPTCTVSPRPKLGSHCSSTAKTQISRTPIRKVGSDTPTSETVMIVLDSQPLRLSAV